MIHDMPADFRGEPMDRLVGMVEPDGIGGRNAPAAARPDSRLAGLAAPLALAISDLGTYAAAGVALVPFGAGDADTARFLSLVAVAAVSAFASARIYPGYRLHLHERLRRRVIATLKIGCAACLGALVLFSAPGLLGLIGAFMATGLVLQLLLDTAIPFLVRQLGFWGKRTAILGPPADVALMTAFFQRNWRYGICPEAAGSPAARVALIAGADMPRRAECDALLCDFEEVSVLADLPVRRFAGLRSSDLGGQICLRMAVRERPASFPGLFRAIDLAIAIPALLVSIPLMGLAAVAIKIVDPGPALYRQVREGLNGRPILLLKLRTMYQDADIRHQKLLAEDPAARAEWETYFKLRDDPRVLPIVGHLLRSSSMDELPQLLAVITGDMRIVGPRPFPDYHLAAMDREFRNTRCSITPGLTGLWQVSERSAADIAMQQDIDRFYIENRSVWLDLAILLQTFSAILRRRGAY